MKSILHFTLLCALLFLGACEQGMPETESTQRKLTVNCLFSPQDTFSVHTSLSNNAFNPQKDSFISNATVRLTLPDGTTETILPDSRQYDYRTFGEMGYYTHLQPIPHQDGYYTLSVEAPGYGSIVASDTVPPPVPIDYCTLTMDTTRNLAQFQIAFTDPEPAKNCYAVSVSGLMYLTNCYPGPEGMDCLHDIKWVKYMQLESPNLFVEAKITPARAQLVFSDILLESAPTQTLIRISCSDFFNTVDSASFDVHLHSLSRGAYEYAVSYYRQYLAAKEFYAEPVSVFSNIAGGYGIFAGYSTSTVRVKYTK